MDESDARGLRMLEHVILPDRYLLLRHVADGGMASVWCAQDRVLGRRVAIKLLSERFAGDDDAGRRFEREARTAARLSGHRNVITIYDVGEPRAADGGGSSQAFIVMEYLAGGTVADAMRLGPITPADATRWVHETAAALDYAHGHGVLHRDIKPANLLLDRDRVVHVADFGIAQLTTDDTLTLEGKLLGTAAYLAPERARGKATTDASDRYSLAVVAFELLTGQRPFSAERFAAQARQHIDVPAPLASRRNPVLPAAVDDVLARGMAKRPDERWPTSQEFADALEAALVQPGDRAAARARATRALRPIPAGSAARTAPSRRRPTLSAAGAAAMAGTDAPAPAQVAPPAAPASDDPPAEITPPPSFAAAVPPAAPPSDPPGKPARRRRSPPRALALAALAAAAVGVGLAVGAGQHGSSDHDTGSLQAKRPAHADQPAKHAAAKPKPAPSHPHPKPKPKPKPAADDHGDRDRDPAGAPGHRHLGVADHAAADGRDARRPRPRADAGRVLHRGDPGAAPGAGRRVAEQPHLRLRAVRPRPLAAVGRRSQGRSVGALPAAEDPQPDGDGQARAAGGAAGARPAVGPQRRRRPGSFTRRRDRHSARRRDTRRRRLPGHDGTTTTSAHGDHRD